MQKSNPLDRLTGSATELRALQRYMIESFELQQFEPSLREHLPAARVIEDTLSILRGQLEQLDRHIFALPGSRTALQAATATMAGAFLSYLTKTRSHDAAKILRDDFTLLNLASMHYLMLQVSAKALGRHSIADLALGYHQELTGLVKEFTEVIQSFVSDTWSRETEPTEVAESEHRVEHAKETQAGFVISSSVALA